MKVVFVDAANEELHEAANYLESRQAGLGERFLDQVKRAELLISRFPDSGHRLGPRLRRIVARRFHYVLIYRTTDNAVEIIAVAHQRQHPRYWRSRLKKS